jgi:hypothetical protein
MTIGIKYVEAQICEEQSLAEKGLFSDGKL